MNVVLFWKDGSNWFNVFLVLIGEYNFDVIIQNFDGFFNYVVKYKICCFDINLVEVNELEQLVFDLDVYFKVRGMS